MNKIELKEFRNKHGLTQSELAIIAGVGVGTVQSWEQGNRNISQSALRLIEIYDKSNNVVREVLPKYEKLNKVEVGKPHISDIKIECGIPNGFSSAIMKSDCERLYIPFAGDYDFSIIASGESMINRKDNKRSINPGDILACKIIKSRSHIRWGEVYAISTIDGFTTKKIIESEKDGYVKCVSFNSEDGYSSFDIPLDEIFDWALVVCVVSINRW